MSENELRLAFRELTASVKPSEDGVEAVMRRGSSGGNGTGWKVGLALASLLVALVAVPTLMRPGPAEPAPDAPIFWPAHDAAPMTPWIQALIDTPTRGSLAANRAFIDEVSTHYARTQAVKLKILYAGDVGEFRIVVAAYYDSTRQTGIYRTAWRGTPAREFGTSFFSDPLRPYLTTTIATLSAVWPEVAVLALAPEDCVISTTDGQGGVRQNPADPSQFAHVGPVGQWKARVTCDETLRYEGPLSSSGRFAIVAPPRPADTRVEVARQGARGDVPWEAAMQLLGDCSRGSSFKILFGGTVEGAHSPVYVAWCRLADGRWEIRNHEQGGYRLKAGLPADADPSRADSVVAAPSTAGFVVIAPPAASKVEVLGAAGEVVASATLTGGVGTLPGKTSGRLRATDADGKVVGTGITPLEARPPSIRPDPPIPVTVDNWA